MSADLSECVVRDMMVVVVTTADPAGKPPPIYITRFTRGLQKV